MKKEYLKVRDFIYMDVEKLKSILAQIMKGLPESQAHTSTDGTTLKGSLGASHLISLRDKFSGILIIKLLSVNSVSTPL